MRGATTIISSARGPITKRLFSSTPINSSRSPALTLHSVSPLIRPHRTSTSGSSSSLSNSQVTSSTSTLTGVKRETESKPSDFLLWPDFFTPQECRVLLEMALWKLDRVDVARKRTRRGRGSKSGVVTGSKETAGSSTNDMEALQDQFVGGYGFEEGHYDSVIHQYRETLLSSLPPSPTSSPSLSSILTRLYSLLPDLPPPNPDSLPPQGTSTHLLHLAPEGEILGHVDNLQASGSVICGVSLGAERTLRLVRAKGEGEGWDVKLTSGSVYLQRDSIRYGYEHSILHNNHEGSVWDGERLKSGHRISIMIRDAPSQPAKLDE
ncbi:hypothetical protein CI109_102626 [Kwoniella shandongensis]|uniref:Uncharacterized protein n=1 Tax=Kwoniella shandongensis TaxID=1734106 RepID=A0A5M6BUA4_9TREE|nr:uncharacterized protein CI109_005207 [Kwoniella shandongensis]KAA5526438.1 hypothetical protein CI109_005207 [Kwoniella shandongensis]